jgi:hypothetical protein
MLTSAPDPLIKEKRNFCIEKIISYTFKKLTIQILRHFYYIIIHVPDLLMFWVYYLAFFIFFMEAIVRSKNNYNIFLLLLLFLLNINYGYITQTRPYGVCHCRVSHRTGSQKIRGF